MLVFNWGIFWAILAAWTVRALFFILLDKWENT
jgi:hypothetical protein